MDNIAVWSAFGITLALCFGTLIFKGFSLIRIYWLNLARLRDLKKKHNDPTTHPDDQTAIGIVTDFCEGLRAKWILGEPDLCLLQNTRDLVANIAKSYHPDAPTPLAEARLGKLLEAFLDLKNQITELANTKGIHTLTQFRLRHVLFLSQAWEKKQEWDSSPVGSFFKKFRIYFLTQWIYFLIRCMDLSFWIIKMLTYLIYDVIFKVLLVRWYLVVGELALGVYRDRDQGPGIQEEKIIEEFETMPDPDDLKVTGLPEGVKNIVDASRKNILFNPWALEWQKTWDIYTQLVADIARFYHPQAKHPLYEVKLFGIVRFWTFCPTRVD